MSVADLKITAGRENGRRRPRGYDSSYRPHAKTRILLDQVQAVLDEYEDHLPLTIRQIFYRLVGQYGYEKTENAYGRLVEALGRARRARLIPFDAIRDDGMLVVIHEMYASIADFDEETASRARNYRRDLQYGQPQYLELWCEAAGMLHQLARVAGRYSVPVYSGGGFGSLTGNYAIARRALQRHVPTVILHVGDFDPSGESIFTATTEDAALFVEADRTILPQRIEAERVALTADQVKSYGLPTSPPKETDSRSATWSGGTCQLEALAPDELARIVEDAICARLVAKTFNTQRDIEAGERAFLLGLPSGGAK